MPQTDPWERAAECARAIQATSDPRMREMLTHLQELWTSLGNSGPFLTGSIFTDHMVASMNKIHAELMRPVVH
jgi:hypothetical protein